METQGPSSGVTSESPEKPRRLTIEVPEDALEDSTLKICGNCVCGGCGDCQQCDPGCATRFDP